MRTPMLNGSWSCRAKVKSSSLRRNCHRYLGKEYNRYRTGVLHKVRLAFYPVVIATGFFLKQANLNWVAPREISLVPIGWRDLFFNPRSEPDACRNQR